MTLDQLSPGQSAHVVALHLTGRMRQRLSDLGFIPGVCVTAVHVSPFGDPVAYRVLGTVIALRRKDAASIEIT
ncbi:MAG: ferrous iron transport protein A [Clostridiales bacterium]|nr:ferrous iron transport protein A [Candidatus Cacconaster stercorequi]